MVWANILKKYLFWKKIEGSNTKEAARGWINHFVQKRNEKTELFQNWKWFYKINQLENNNDYQIQKNILYVLEYALK